VTEQTHEPGPGRSTEPGPGPGRSTSDAAFAKLKREIAQRNEQTQNEGRKLRAARESEAVRRRRQEDLR
jgi:hypothetical protein